MERVRTLVKGATDEQLMQMWVQDTSELDNNEIAINAIIEAELEKRNLIKLNEDTFEYEILA